MGLNNPNNVSQANIKDWMNQTQPILNQGQAPKGPGLERDASTESINKAAAPANGIAWVS